MRKKLGNTSLPPDEPSLNLTPLIDVVFVLLIVFILVAPILESDRVELAHGSSLVNGKNTPSQSPISISVKEDNTLLYNGDNLSMGELGYVLKEAYVKYPQAKPQLFHDKKASFGTYQSIKNRVEEAGFTEMDVVLNPF